MKESEKTIYTVKGTDTLWGIARDVLGDPNLYNDIRKWNNLSGFVIKPGQKLYLYDPEEEKK